MKSINVLKKEWKQHYESVKAVCNDYQSRKVSDTILELVLWSLDFLNNRARKIQLNSKIKGKTYHSYCLSDNKSARPANSEFFLNDAHVVAKLWKSDFGKLNQNDLQNVFYTAA
jgi:hypothetical protein